MRGSRDHAPQLAVCEFTQSGFPMIDFQNASYIKLNQVDYSQVAGQIDPY
ncbi:hypothetical protein LQK93_01943 [Terrabacter sp. BE26]